jgi:osmotically-inducible protein OsmY
MIRRASLYGSALGASLTLAACGSAPPCISSDCSADAGITDSVRRQLTMVSILPEDAVTVQTIDHVVYLRGTVDTERDLLDAAQLAGNVAGVRRVVNNLALSR